MSAHFMSSYESRRETFYATDGSKPPTGKRRATHIPKQPCWPHPTSATNVKGKSYPLPNEMANLGLYFDSTKAAASSVSGSDDVCTLYPEGVTISQWKGGDDPRSRIRDVLPDAALLLIMESKDALVESRVGSEAYWTCSNEALLPNSATMSDARLRTFGSLWPCDGKKGWKPTSKKVSIFCHQYKI